MLPRFCFFGFRGFGLVHLPSKIKRALRALMIFALTANWIYLLANH